MWRLFRLAHGPGMDGAGALYADGRWHARGQSTVYFGGCAAIAVLERLAHTDPDLVPSDLRLGRFEYTDRLAVARIEDLTLLPQDWPRDEAATRKLGTAWRMTAGSACLLSVPSVVVAEERNLVLNPTHPDASQVRFVNDRAFRFDSRVL